MSEDKKDIQQPTLTEFIEKNHKLITTAGVLTTLAVLAIKLPQNQSGISGKFLSFLLFVLALIVCIEIYGNFHWVEEGKLYWFQKVFELTVLGFILVWITIFYQFIFAGLALAVVFVAWSSAVILVFALCSAGIRKLVLKIPWFKRVSQRTKEQLIPMFGAMALITTGLIIFKFFWRH
jgi:hypothetical protein